MEQPKTFADYFLGEIPFYPEWLMLLAMFLLGGFIFQRWKAQKGAENKSGKFQWQYFLKDPQNYIDLVGNIPLGWFVLRFFSLEGDMEYLMIYSVFLGTLGNTIVDLGFDLARGKNPLRKYGPAFNRIKSIFKSK
jgi:hypothetical protein